MARCPVQSVVLRWRAPFPTVKFGAAVRGRLAPGRRCFRLPWLSPPPRQVLFHRSVLRAGQEVERSPRPVRQGPEVRQRSECRRRGLQQQPESESPVSPGFRGAPQGPPLLTLVLPGRPGDVACPRVPRAAGCGTPGRIAGLRGTRARGRTARPLPGWTCGAFLRRGCRWEAPGKVFKRWMSGSRPRGFRFLPMRAPDEHGGF